MRDKVQRELSPEWYVGVSEPRLFDGSRAPRGKDLLTGIEVGHRVAPIGQSIDLQASTAVVDLPDAPGRNLAVLGAGAPSAVRVLATATAGLARGYEPGTVDIVVAELVEEAVEPVKELTKRLAEAGHTPRIVGRDGIRAAVDDLAARVTENLASGGRPARCSSCLGPTPPIRCGSAAARGAAFARALRTRDRAARTRLVAQRPAAQGLLTMGAVVDDVGARVALDAGTGAAAAAAGDDAHLVAAGRALPRPLQHPFRRSSWCREGPTESRPPVQGGIAALTAGRRRRPQRRAREQLWSGSPSSAGADGGERPARRRAGREPLARTRSILWVVLMTMRPPPARPARWATPRRWRGSRRGWRTRAAVQRRGLRSIRR
jgi:hypothetical protein